VHYEAVAELRHLAGSFLREKIEPHVGNSEERLQRLTRLAQSLPVGQRDHALRRISILRSWNKNSRGCCRWCYGFWWMIEVISGSKKREGQAVRAGPGRGRQRSKNSGEWALGGGQRSWIGSPDTSHPHFDTVLGPNNAGQGKRSFAENSAKRPRAAACPDQRTEGGGRERRRAENERGPHGFRPGGYSPEGVTGPTKTACGTLGPPTGGGPTETVGYRF